MGNSQPSGSSTPSSETFFDETDSSQERRATHGTHISKDVLDHIHAKKKRGSSRSSQQKSSETYSIDIEVGETLSPSSSSSVLSDKKDDDYEAINNSYILRQLHVNEKTNKIITRIVDEEEISLAEKLKSKIDELEEKLEKNDYRMMNNKEFFNIVSKDCLEEEEDLEDCLEKYGPRKCGKLMKDYNLCSLKAKFNSMKNEI